MIMKAYAEVQVDMYFNKEIRDKYEKMLPINPNYMAIDEAIKVWGPSLEKKLPMIKETLMKDGA